MSTSLDDLMKIEGVIAAGEFTLEGRLVDYRADMAMTNEMAAMSARLCAPVNIMFETLAREFMRFSEMAWVPPRGWAFSGGEWTIAIGGTRGVFVETAKADFNELFRALVCDGEATPPHNGCGKIATGVLETLS